jgi:hypothetical protein
MYCPLAFTVYVPFSKLALPARPTEPISRSVHPVGRAAEATVSVTTTLLVRLPDTPETVMG